MFADFVHDFESFKNSLSTCQEQPACICASKINPIGPYSMVVVVVVTVYILVIPPCVHGCTRIRESLQADWVYIIYLYTLQVVIM